jgi:chromosome segregation ATPase
MRPSTPKFIGRSLTASGLPSVQRGPPELNSLDGEYNRNLLNQRMSELNSAITSMKTEIKSKQTELENKDKLTMEKDEIASEVENLRMEICDLNEAIHEMRVRKSGKNLAPSADDLRIHVTELEDECQRLSEIKQQLQQVSDANEAVLLRKRADVASALASLNQEKREEFKKCKESWSDLHIQGESIQAKILSLKGEIQAIEEHVKLNPKIPRSVELRAKIKVLEHEKALLDDELHLYALPVSEQKDRILKFVKELNGRNAEIEALTKNLSSEIRKTDERALAIRSDQRDRFEKHRIVANKKIELDNMIQTASVEQERLDKTIVDLQRKIIELSERLLLGKEVSGTGLVTEGIRDSVYTNDQLNQEIQRRKQEIDKLDDIEASYLEDVSVITQETLAAQNILKHVSDLKSSKQGNEESISTLLNEQKSLCDAYENEKAKCERDSMLMAKRRLQFDKNTLNSTLLRLEENIELILNEISTLNSRIRQAMLIEERTKLTDTMRRLNEKIKHGQNSHSIYHARVIF